MGRDARSPDDARRIDELYGLEPVLEPGNTADSGSSPARTEPHSVECPYCGERFETLLDLSAGSSSCIEDCHICCRPIEFRVDVDECGSLVALTTLRCD